MIPDVNLSLDALGRIDAVSATTGGTTQTLAANIAYRPFGPVAGFGYGNGIPLARVFDQDYRLTGQTAGGVQEFALGYDPANNIMSLIDGLDGARTQSFAYDGLNRLTQGVGIYGTQAYGYDAIGNRLTLNTAAGLDTYSYGPNSHRLEAIAGPNPTSFAYDANGNTLAKGPLGFTYDATNNRMTEARASGIVVGTYVYNDKGERVKKTVARTTGKPLPVVTILNSMPRQKTRLGINQLPKWLYPLLPVSAVSLKTERSDSTGWSLAYTST